MTARAQSASESRTGGVDVSNATATLRRLGPPLASWLLPFVLVLYLALEDGGYESVTRGEVGVAIWWIVLVGAAIGVLPSARIGRSGWIGIGLLTAFAAWTGLGIGWSESAERSAEELARVAMLLGVFVLALSAQRQGAARRVVAGTAAAISVVAIIALLSRMEPTWVGTEAFVEFLPGTIERLSYPLGYWNALAALMAIGLPLVIWLASDARTSLVRALSMAMIPAFILTAFLTLSRGGAVALAIGVAALVVLYPRRLRLAAPLLLGGAGGGLLISGATQRDAFQDGLVNSAASSQGAEMQALTLIVCGGVGLLGAAIALSDRHGLGPRFPRPSARATAITAGALAAIVLVAGLALGGGEISDRWQEFKEPNTAGTGAERFGSASGGNRYQYWETAIDANSTDPLVGIGPGTFEFWWARNNPLETSTSLFVKDAHSLYFETLAELGIIGLILIVGLIGFVLATGATRTMRRRAGPTALLAAATAGATAFAVAAAVDWAWEMTVLPAIFLLLAAVVLGRDTEREEGGPDDEETDRRPHPGLRIGLVAGSAVALVAIAIPLAGLTALDDSQAEVRGAALNSALSEARTARDIQPYASSPYLQEALVLELGGNLDAAAAAARRATAEEPTNWRPWLVLSRIEAGRGRPAASVEAFREARSLNPKSPLFAETEAESAP